IQYALALQHGGLLQGSFLRSRRGCRGPHYRGFLLDPLNQLLATLLLKFTNLDSFEYRCAGICCRQEPASALHERTQAFAWSDAINTWFADFTPQGDRRADVVPVGLLGHGQHIAV